MFPSSLLVTALSTTLSINLSNILYMSFQPDVPLKRLPVGLMTISVAVCSSVEFPQCGEVIFLKRGKMSAIFYRRGTMRTEWEGGFQLESLQMNKLARPRVCKVQVSSSRGRCRCWCMVHHGACPSCNFYFLHRAFKSLGLLHAFIKRPPRICPAAAALSR